MKTKLICLAFIVSISVAAGAQTGESSAGELVFTPIVEVKATSVKNQSETGTCWSFATTSFIESELLRMGKGEYDLSEMYIIRYNYIDKLNDNYAKQGRGNTKEGGLSHDWLKIFTERGIAPDEAYTGLNYGSTKHNHGELNRYLNAVAETSVELRSQNAPYRQTVESILDAWLGEAPENFTYKGALYTPASFAQSLEITPDDYIEITSYTHFPFYSKGVLEIPDNWRMRQYYNVPVDELMQIMDNTLSAGYTIGWDGDISESGFSDLNAMAVFPSNVTQEERQAMFENFTTTDDHMMHVTGIAQDQNGQKYYITKNSWGVDGNKYGGYIYMSEQYVRAKTVFILVNKNSIPQSIRAKLGV